MFKLKEVDFSFADSRGSLIQLVHSGYEQVNVLISKSGVVRGGHFHKIVTECFYVISGSVEVLLTREDEYVKVIFKTGDFFEIQPYVIHSMSFPEDCVLVAMYDQCVELGDGRKDIYSV